MLRCLGRVFLIASLTALFLSQLAAEEDSGWRISPENINIQMGDDRHLQLLDDSAQELHGICGLSLASALPHRSCMWGTDSISRTRGYHL